MLSETDILTATNGARLLYLLATCGSAAIGSWLYQSMFALTVTRDEIIASTLLGVVFFLFAVGMMFWNIYFVIIGGLIFGFAVTRRLEIANEKRDNF